MNFRVFCVSSVFWCIVAGLYYLFVRHHPLNWGPSLYGYYSGFSTGTGCLCNLVVIPVLSKVYGVKDTILIIIGIVSFILGDILFGISTQTWMIFMGKLIYLCAAFVHNKHTQGTVPKWRIVTAIPLLSLVLCSKLQV